MAILPEYSPLAFLDANVGETGGRPEPGHNQF